MVRISVRSVPGGVRDILLLSVLHISSASH